MNVLILLRGEDISLYYSQTLCLMAFPRAKFPDGLPEDHIPRVELFCEKSDNGYKAKAVIADENGVFEGEFRCAEREKIYMETSKFAVGRAFVEAAQKSGRAIGPWGLLTGIRPAKPFLTALMCKEDTDRIEKLLVEDCLVSAEKASLCKRASKTEYEAISGIKQRSCSIYISIPFCPTRCAYCSFVSYALPNLMALIPEYLTHLCNDIKNTAKTVKKLGLSVASVYIGGGTPTTLDKEQLGLLLDTVCGSFDMGEVLEFCVEAGRPDTIDKEKLSCMKAHGVDRISINPQTLKDETLKIIGRRHSVKDFYAAYDLARDSGIKNKNVDLIFGLPEESPKDLENSVEGILALSPENITVHTFCVKKSADLSQSEDPLSGYSLAPYQQAAFDKIEAQGYVPYYVYRQKNARQGLENIGFTKKGHEGIYNIVMMDEVHTVIGIGAGASTRLTGRNRNNIRREYTPKYPFEYKNFDYGTVLSAVEEFYDNEYED